MNMSFDQMRGEVAPAARTMTMGGAMPLRSMLTHGGAGSGTMHALPPPVAQIPDNPQELQVFLSGPGANAHARGSGIGLVEAKQAVVACKGKRDFILFEELDNAVPDGRRVVLVMPLGARSSEIKQAQAYLAASLADWLSENKVDGAGRPYGECKDEDPTLRKRFTRAQINAIRAFGKEGA